MLQVGAYYIQIKLTSVSYIRGVEAKQADGAYLLSFAEVRDLFQASMSTLVSFFTSQSSRLLTQSNNDFDHTQIGPSKDTIKRLLIVRRGAVHWHVNLDGKRVACHPSRGKTILLQQGPVSILAAR
jgi:hypothetical protein